MKKILILLCYFTSLAESAEIPTQEEKIAFVEYYREWCSLAKEFPKNQEVKVIFVDLDQDGICEALATSKGGKYEDGLAWTVFRKTGNSWGQISGFNATTSKPKKNATLFARPGEFFLTRKKADSFEFCILSENYDILAPQGKGRLKKTRFYLDEKGVLHQSDIPDLEKYLAYQVSGAKWPDDSLIRSLERLTVEVFSENDAVKK